MTSQVVLMNSVGVALASDSMVTFGTDQTFPSVSKIFTLGGDHKIAIMVSGSANYIPGNILWERVVAMWSEHIGADKTLSSIDEYVKEIIHFLQHETELNNETDNSFALQRTVIKWLYSEVGAIKIYLDAKDTMDSMKQEFEELDTDEFLKNLEKHCFDELRNFKIRQKSMVERKMDDAEFKLCYENLEKYNRENILAAIELMSTQFQHHSTESDDWDNDGDVRGVNLFELVLAHLAWSITSDKGDKLMYPGQEHTKITLAGFGDNDVVPKMVELISTWNEWGSAPLRERKKHQTAQLCEGFVIRKQTTLTDQGNLIVLCDECTHQAGREVEIAADSCDHPYNRRYQSAIAFLRGIAVKTEIDTVLNGMRRESFPALEDPEKYAGKTASILSMGILNDIQRIKGIGEDKMLKLTNLFKAETSEKITHLLHSELQQINNEGWIKRRQEFREIIARLPMAEIGRFAHHLVNHQAVITHLMEPIRYVGGEIILALVTKEKGVEFIAY